ncbi:hypothetical protein R3I94_015724 [Phoxinus phoxinus]|uniref:Uncharacterized protein n=1 Tax=Phoxinus phoxinus TaxID=58324 RepID=A0AAN9CW30_9TELE
MWMMILLVIWIIFFVDDKAINECCLFLQTLATAKCQLYLALLPLRLAPGHFAKAAWSILTEPRVNDSDNILSTTDAVELLLYLLPYLGKAAVHYLEGVCLLWESLSQFLAVVSSVCVAVRHGLQGALFLIVSTARWLQRMMLCKGDVDEWMKEQNQQRERIEKQRRQVEEYLHAVDPLTGKRRKKGGDKS